MSLNLTQKISEIKLIFKLEESYEMVELCKSINKAHDLFINSKAVVMMAIAKMEMSYASTKEDKSCKN